MITRATARGYVPPAPCLPECIRHSARSALADWKWQRTDGQRRTDSPTEGQFYRPSFAARGCAERDSTFWRAQQHPRSEPGPGPWQPSWSLVGRTICPNQCLILLQPATLKKKTYVGFIPLPERSSVDLDDSSLDEGVCSDKFVIGSVVNLEGYWSRFFTDERWD